MSKDIYNPDHYLNEAGYDLFEEWYIRYPFEVFRIIMWCTAERYFRRYFNKNGIEDLRKGMRVVERLEEYEERYSNEKYDKFTEELEEAILYGLPEKDSKKGYDTDGDFEIFRTNYYKEVDVLEAVYKALHDVSTESIYFYPRASLEELKTAIYDRLDALEKAYSILHWDNDGKQ